MRVQVNDGPELVSIWNGDKIDLQSWLIQGENRIRLTLVNNLRNLLGPHHLEEGESYSVGPGSFFKEPCVWSVAPPAWNEEYCFVETSLG